jgi:hypothetical protein
LEVIPMSAHCPTRPALRSLDAQQAGFLAILPAIQAHAAFGHLRCPHDREDAVAETVGLCWEWFHRLSERGRDAARFPVPLAGLAVRRVAAATNHVEDGRHV